MKHAPLTLTPETPAVEPEDFGLELLKIQGIVALIAES